MNTLREQWESYSARVLPSTASAVQRQECRRAFYCGARAFQKIMTAEVDRGATRVQGAQRLEALRQELAQFISDVNKGRA